MLFFKDGEVRSCLTPKEILTGDGSSEKIGDLFDGWQVTEKAVLVAADREVSRLGLLDRVRKPLEGCYQVHVFDAIAGEPTLETASALVKAARERPYGAVVGVGGGSAMDMAKLAAAAGTNAGEVSGWLGTTRFERAPLPSVLVPTTAGTGAEVTAVSMLFVEGRKAVVLSPQLVPQAAVLDPLLTMSLPPPVTASTGLDALSHALEGFMSLRAGPFSDTQALATLSMVSRWLRTAYRDGGNIEARRAMIYAAFTGGLTLNAGVVLGHSVAYTIANKTRLAHGTSCAMALPYTIAYNAPAIGERLRAAARRVLDREDASPEDLAVWVVELNRELGMPDSLQALGIQEGDLEGMVEECLAKYPRPTNPVPLTKDRLGVFYRKMFDGDVQGCVDALRRL